MVGDDKQAELATPALKFSLPRLILEWSAVRYEEPVLSDAAERVEAAVKEALLRRDHVTGDLGGTAHPTHGRRHSGCAGADLKRNVLFS